MVRAVPVGAWRSPVSALVWGTRGREFKSRRPDQTAPKNKDFLQHPKNSMPTALQKGIAGA
jgi:hypothetical protein